MQHQLPELLEIAVIIWIDWLWNYKDSIVFDEPVEFPNNQDNAAPDWQDAPDYGDETVTFNESFGGDLSVIESMDRNVRIQE